MQIKEAEGVVLMQMEMCCRVRAKSLEQLLVCGCVCVFTDSPGVVEHHSGQVLTGLGQVCHGEA